jgi:hypothetical protein
LCFASEALSFRFEAKMTAIFASFSFRLIFVSLHIYTFRIDAKQAKKAFFGIEAKQISLPFRFISLRSENDGAP